MEDENWLAGSFETSVSLCKVSCLVLCIFIAIRVRLRTFFVHYLGAVSLKKASLLFISSILYII